jgi:hypothetical protein
LRPCQEDLRESPDNMSVRHFCATSGSNWSRFVGDSSRVSQNDYANGFRPGAAVSRRFGKFSGSLRLRKRGFEAERGAHELAAVSQVFQPPVSILT